MKRRPDRLLLLRHPNPQSRVRATLPPRLSVLSALNSRTRGRESARALPPPRDQRIIHRFAASPQRAKGTHRPKPTARRISTTPARKRFSTSTRLDNPLFIDGRVSIAMKGSSGHSHDIPIFPGASYRLQIEPPAGSRSPSPRPSLPSAERVRNAMSRVGGERGRSSTITDV